MHIIYIYEQLYEMRNITIGFTRLSATAPSCIPLQNLVYYVMLYNIIVIKKLSNKLNTTIKTETPKRPGDETGVDFCVFECVLMGKKNTVN